MRIIQVVPSLIKGGAERLALNITDELIKLGHNVLVVSLRDDNRYPELSLQSIRIAKSSVYYSLLGSDVIEIADFESILDDFKPDVVHSHLVDSELVSRHNPRKGVAYVTHWHGCPSLTNHVPWSERFNREYVWKWNVKRRLLNQYTSCSNHFLCISKFIQDYVMSNVGANQSETTVIHNAIDLNRFKPLDLQKKDGFRLISIGSLQKNKNHTFLFKLVKQLLSNGLSDIHLDVFGEGPEHQYLSSLINEMGLSKHITLHGIVSDPEVRLNQSQLLVHSSWHEPFGLIFIEAMACGIPIVSFNTGGPAELIKDGETGYLVEKDDVDSFCARVTELYLNRNLLTSMGEEGKKHAQQFGLEAYVKKIECLYEQRLAVVRK
ncbi:MAG TPA: hypothetical protein DCR04_09330 [Flavobacteriales bacterium]|nr:hypothetical protein [Flavobacteriales bacterium]